MDQRSKELLTAVVQLLEKQEESAYVLHILTETVFYDGTYCDGNCLLQDIKAELDINQ